LLIAPIFDAIRHKVQLRLLHFGRIAGHWKTNWDPVQTLS
jgi:hypothetical protein